MSVVSVLPPAVRTYVRDFDKRARRLALLRAIGLALVVFMTWALACCLLDRIAQLDARVRGLVLGAGTLAIVLILWRPLRAALRKRRNWVDVAGRIEEHDPQFAQRLVTVTSRVLGPAEHRGSDDMLRELLRDVDRRASGENPAKLLPLRLVIGPWLALLVVMFVWAAAWRNSWLEMPTLFARFLIPEADIRPVTTTRLEVPTGSRDVVQSEPLVIEADVARLLDPAGLVSLFVSSDDGEHWSRSTMEPTRVPSRFAFMLTSVDRDMRYYVTAGDATSRTYAVRVRRPPAVEQFAVRYEYPPYTGRAPLTVINGDGLIEAPVGTHATLTVTATEPLESALLTVNGEKILMDRLDLSRGMTSDDAKRQRRAAFTIQRDAIYSLDMISDRQVPGVGPAGAMQIRAIPDSVPLVRLPQAGQSLRLHPREILPVSLQALDDYGIAKLTLMSQTNSATPVEIPIELIGDPRRQEREYALDLATMSLGIGDVVTLVLTATDRAGQKSTSAPVQVLVSPRSVDLATYQRIAELNGAGLLAATLNEQLTAASTALEEADREAATRSLAFLAAINRADRQLSGASETATLLRQSLFRALVNAGNSPELCTTLAGWIDQAQVQSWLAEDLFRRADAPAGMGNESRGLLTRSLESTRVLRDELKAIAAGERAAAVLADRENLAAAQKKADATTQPADSKQRLGQTLARARDDIAAGAKEIGLDPAAADLDSQLKAKVDAAMTLVRSKQPVDFATAGREWAQALQRDRTQPVVLDERLSTAAQAEAVRADSDLVRARDLQLAARAGAQLEAMAQADPTSRVMPSTVFNDYASALAALQREHELAQKAPPAASTQPASAELSKARQDSQQARASMQRWADDSDETFAAIEGRNGVPGRVWPSEAEELALRASAETASRNYAAAAELDAQLARKLATPAAAPTTQAKAVASATTSPSTPRVAQRHEGISRTVQRAAAIDQLGEDQRRLASQIGENLADTTGELADRQRDVADAIGRVTGQPTTTAKGDVPLGEVPPTDFAHNGDPAANDPNWRGRATAAVLAAQEALAAMPQQLAAAQDALPTWRDAVARAEQAKRDAAAMPDATRLPAAERAAAQAARDAADAAQRFDDRRRAVSPSAAQDLAKSLEAFAPETSTASAAINERLLPALQRLEDAAKAGDAPAFVRSAEQARQSIEAAQRELALAQEAVTARDPLVAAKWFARAAADSLARTPPDLRAAQVRQRDTTAALSRAWDRAIHDAASLRMASLPAMQSIYAPPDSRNKPSPTTAPSEATASSNSQSINRTAREWNRLRPPPREPQAGDDVPIRADTDPPGFEEPLRVYFEALSKGGVPPAK